MFVGLSCCLSDWLSALPSFDMAIWGLHRQMDTIALYIGLQVGYGTENKGGEIVQDTGATGLE